MASLAASKADSGGKLENVGSLDFVEIMKSQGYKNITVKSFVKGNKRLVIAIGVENYTVIAIHQSTVKCIPLSKSMRFEFEFELFVKQWTPHKPKDDPRPRLALRF